MTAKADGAEVSQRLSKIETAISRRKTIEFTYYTIERDTTEKRKVDPYHLVYRGGQFYLIGHSHERDAVRVFRLSRIRGKVSYASKAEHDFGAARGLRAPRLRPPRRVAARRDPRATAKIFLRERIAWLVERDFGGYGEFRNPGRGRRLPGQGPDLRDRVRVQPPDGRLGAALAPERDGARSARAGARRSASASSCSTSATARVRAAPSRCGRCPRHRARPARTAARSPRSAPSGSPVS